MSTSSPFEAIVVWSHDWPMWQRDALRRIVVNGQLSKRDIDDLELICKAQHGLQPKAGTVSLPVPLSANHIPAGPDAATSVSLVSLSGLNNVNRLPSEQTVEFGPSPGLTVVYGENGSGKSGYARVIKKACRARGTPPDIKPDAFSATVTGPATAEIVCLVESSQTSVKWTDGKASDSILANIFVFDALSARFHVTDDGPASFTPRGLDVLPKLASACDDIRTRLKTEIDGIEAAKRVTRANWKYNSGTEVAKLLEGLSEITANTEIENAATFTDVDNNRLIELVETLKSDPRLKAQATTAAAIRLRAFAGNAAKFANALGDIAVAKIESALADASGADAAAKATAGPYFDDEFLPGTGGDAWRQLWDIASAFSTAVAYPNKEFPVLAPGSRCVLCQQPLLDESSARLARFDEYVRDEARARAQTAKAKIAAIMQEMRTIDSLASEAARVAADLAGLPVDDIDAIESFSKSVDARLMHVLTCLSTGSWSPPPSLPACPSALVAELAGSLEERAKLELSAEDPQTRELLTAQKEDLEDKDWLCRNKDLVLSHVALLKHASRLRNSQADTATNTLTIKSSHLHDTYVTKAYCQSFYSEQTSLGLNTLPVILESVKGEKGQRQFGVRFDAATAVKVSDVASDGENRCIALAAFLAELSQASHKSALVFDDPVSSLDHKRRAAIADRLVIESKARQVIIFTHDLAFLCDLQDASLTHSVDVHGRHVDWSECGPGRFHTVLPWEGQSSKAQMKTLRELCGNADKVHRERGQEEYRAIALHLCDLIRAAAERMVEEQLLNGVLRRHQSGIRMGALHALGVVEVTDYKDVYEVWKECSALIPSHSASRSKPTVAPQPAKLKAYIETLESVIDRVKSRRKPESTDGMPAKPHRAVALIGEHEA